MRFIDLGIWLGIVVFASGIIWAFEYDAKRRRECEAKGGVYVQSDGPALCINKKSVIK